MEYFVRHRTTYRYLQDVSHSWHLAHLRPRITPLQAVHDSSITLRNACRATACPGKRCAPYWKIHRTKTSGKWCSICLILP
jgi:hypothetical protein